MALGNLHDSVQFHYHLLINLASETATRIPDEGVIKRGLKLETEVTENDSCRKSVCQAEDTAIYLQGFTFF